MEEKAKSLKEEGNKFYKDGRLDSALTCYRKAAALHSDEPVYQSNISAVLYEQGQYTEAIASIHLALALHVAETDPALASRLLLRKAKACFYLNNMTEADRTMTALDKLVDSAKIAHPDPDGHTRTAVNRTRNAVPAQGSSIPFRLCRYPLETQVARYKPIQHDSPFSILSGYLDEAQRKDIDVYEPTDQNDLYVYRDKIAEKAAGRIKLQPPAYHSYSFLFAGLADARHVMLTLADIATNLKSTSKPTSFHFTIVDLNAATVARTLVVLYLLRFIASIPPKQLSSNANAIETIALLQYMSLATLMPSYLYARMVVTMRELRRDLSARSLPPWMVIPPSVSPELIRILDYWIDFKVSNQDVHDRTSAVEKPVPKGEPPKERLAKMTKADLAKFKIEGLSTIDEIRDALRLSTEFMEFDESEQFLLGTDVEYTLYGHTKLLSPPHALLKKHPVFQQYFKMNTNIRERRFASGDTTFSFQHIVKDALDNWKPNSTLWDQSWTSIQEKTGQDGIKFDHDFFHEASNLFVPLAHPARPCSVFDYAFDFYTRVASAIAKLGTGFKFVLEWLVGDVQMVAYDMARNSKDRAEKGLPSTFDRMHLSDIPDYIGGNLSLSILFMPMLKQLPHANISYSPDSPAFFEDFALWSSTLLSRGSNEIYLGMKLQNPKLYEPPRWAPAHLPVAKLATQDELTLWLYRIFLFIVLPPHSDSDMGSNYPLNLLSFVHLLIRLAAIGYPPHWLGTALDALLSGRIKTKARPPPNSLNTNVSLATISTKPFLVDLESAVISCESILPFRLFSTPMLYPLHRIVLEIPSIKIQDDVTAPVLAILFGLHDDLTAMKAINLREAFVTGGEPKMHIYSNARWISATKEVEVWIPQNRLEAMLQSDWHFAPIRMDYWVPLAMPQPIKPK